MSSKQPQSKSKRTRHRITEIELVPTTSNRQISAKVLVDDEVVCELPWIKSGRTLRWTKLIVHDGFKDSKVAAEICEKHKIKDRRFRSNAYVVSSVQDQTEVIVEFFGTAWSASFKLLTPTAAERSFAEGLDKLKELQSAQSTLEKLGRARPVFEAMLQLGSEISEIHPTAKMMFTICTKAWEKLEEQEQINENVRELLDGLSGILDFVEMVKKHARTERLQEVIGDFLNLLEDVSICVMERAGSANSTARTLRSLLDSREHDKTKLLMSRFERIRAELAIGIGAETHKKVHTLDLHALLSQLRPVDPSGYDPSRACQEETRERIISNIVLWTEQDAASECMLWVHGQAGIGKSSIATSVCQQLANEKVLGASFFCKRDDPGLRDPLRLINSIAHGLATQYPPYERAVATAIEENRELCTAHMNIRYEGLIKRPLQSLPDPLFRRPLIILIDAIDECGTEGNRQNLLRHLSDMSKLVPWLKVIVTSRPDGDIQEFFQGLDMSHMSSRDVHSFDASADIRAYIEKELGDIARRHQWSEGTIDQLCEKAEGMFIWAATVKNYLTGFRGSTVPRLRKILDDQKSTVSDHLDTLYRSVILAGMKDPGDDQKALFRQCIGLIVMTTTRQPLSISSLGSLLLGQLDHFALEEVVNNLKAVLHIDEHPGGAVRLYHPSFADYATNPSRSEDLYVFPNERNTELAIGCLKTMERELRFNICELETSYLFNDQVPDLAERIKSKIGDQLSYACTYWISHVMDTPQETLMNQVESLMNSPRVLYWLEMLSLLGKVEVGLQGLLELQDWLPESADELMQIVEDIYRFTSAFYDPISSSAPHVYVSALALAPSLTPMVRRFRNLFPGIVTVTSGEDTDWPRWLSSLVHPTEVTSLAVSSNGRVLFSGCMDGTVRMWDVRSGTTVNQPLVGHSDHIRCVALSSDGSRVASGSADKTLRLWDTKVGIAIGEPLIGHSDPVQSVAFSPDDSRIASGSLDGSVCLWDTKTGAAVGDPLIGHSSMIFSVAFSPSGNYLISSALDSTVRVWDIKTSPILGQTLLNDASGICAVFSPESSHIAYTVSTGLGIVKWDTNAGALVGEPLIQQSSDISSLAFSSSGRQVVAGTYSKTVDIWDLQGDSMMGEQLFGHLSEVTSVAFLPDGRRVASGSYDKTVRLWDTRPRPNNVVDKSLINHSGFVNSVAFSPDGSRIVSGSRDETVRLWDTKTGASVGKPLVGHSGAVLSVRYSPDGRYIVSSSSDKTLRIWNAETGFMIGEPLVRHPDTVVALSPNCSHMAIGSRNGTLTVAFIAVSPDQKRPVSGTEDLVELWSTKASRATGDQPTNHLDSVTVVAFSPDGTLIASGSDDRTIRLWNVTTGAAVGDPLVGHSDGVTCVSFSPDGDRIASGSQDKTIRVWDTKTGAAVSDTFVGHTEKISFVAFSPDGSRITSCADDRTVRLWDIKVGVSVGEPLLGSWVAFSPDGDRIVTYARDMIIRMWDATNGTSVGEPLVGHKMPVTSVAFSPDGNCIASGSWDGSVRVWNSKQSLPKPPVDWPEHTFGLQSHPKHHGWVSLDGKPLLWLPGHYRRDYSPHTRYTISADPSLSTIRLDFSEFAHGSSWASVACEKVRQNFV